MKGLIKKKLNEVIITFVRQEDCTRQPFVYYCS